MVARYETHSAGPPGAMVDAMLMTLKDAFARAIAAELRGDRAAARAIYDDVLAAVPEHPGALLGIVRQMHARDDRHAAQALLERAFMSARAMGLPEAELWVERGRVEMEARDWTSARTAYECALVHTPRFLPALLGAGDAALADGNFVVAEGHYRAALGGGERVAPWRGLAQGLAGQRRFAEAQDAMRQAFALSPPDRGTLAAAAWVALEMKDSKAAEAHCRAGLGVAPRDATLLGLLGRALKSLGAPTDARKAFEAAIAADPNDASAHVGLGAVLLDLGRPVEAAVQLQTALAAGATGADVHANLGLACLLRDDYEAAGAMLRRAVEANPRLTPAMANLLTAQWYLCAWEGLDALESRIVATIDDPHGDQRLSPFVALGLPITPAQQLVVARSWSRDMLPAVVAPAVIHARGNRLRVGYLSNDFRDHPTGRLIVGLIESHDRRRFEAFGYGYDAAPESPLRSRITAAFDHWRDLAFSRDPEIAQAIRTDRIDVLVECKGHTRGGRLGALAERPATVQLHYLAFPGTLGYDAIDGLIADSIVIPPEDDLHYHERVFRLPRSYFVTDDARGLPERASRADHGLPAAALVLASLNQAYKLTPDVFSVWMEALRAAPGAILWLFANHPRAQANLRAEALGRGIAGERLVFAPSLQQDAHIARLRCADLALDTLPYGSHTTGADALWAGVPLLTCTGTGFVGRVGASLLEAVGLPDLVAFDLDQYRRLLIELVRNPQRLRDYSMHLDTARADLPLWNTRAFARDFERLLEHAYTEVASTRPRSISSIL